MIPIWFVIFTMLVSATVGYAAWQWWFDWLDRTGKSWRFRPWVVPMWLVPFTIMYAAMCGVFYLGAT